MYCKKCGSEISDDAVVCTHCGVATSNQIVANNDTGGFGWGLLGFCVPLVGLILYLVWKTERPKSSKAAGKGALISTIIGVAFYIIYIVIIMGVLGISLLR